MPIDIAKLREHVITDRWLTATLHSILRTQKRKRVTTFDVVQKHMDAPKDTGLHPHNGVVGAFRLLEACCAGRLHDPGIKNRTRFEWIAQPASVCTSVLNTHIPLPDADYFNPADAIPPPPPPPQVPQPPPGWVRYRFPLREDAEICMDLPGDLTDSEAQRIGLFVRASARNP